MGDLFHTHAGKKGGHLIHTHAVYENQYHQHWVDAYDANETDNSHYEPFGSPLVELPVKGSERYVTFRERLWAICMDACLDAWQATEPPSDEELDDIAAKVLAALREEEWWSRLQGRSDGG